MSTGGARGYRLGIDFGTSTTVGVLRRPDGDVRPLLIDGSPLLPSAVYASADGRLLVGRDAVHAARMDPGRLEPSPKRRIAEGRVLLGDRELEAVALVAAVLGRVGEEATRVGGAPPTGVTLTHPASWGSTRRGLLVEAARRAGLPPPRLVPEPVAAASYFTEVLRHAIPAGSAVVVYDFGAGTFDASAVIRGAVGFETAVVDGLEDAGGLDLDAAIVEHLSVWGARQDPAGWQRLSRPATPADRQQRQELWTDARTCKEQLSRSASAELAVVPLGLRTHLTRQEFDALARPLVDRTVRTTRGVLRHAGLRPDQVAGVFLVGGSSRIPLVAAELHRQLGIAPTIIEQPELVVAEGSVRMPADTGTDDGHHTRILPVLAPNTPRPTSPAPLPAPRPPAVVAPVPVSPAVRAPVSPSPAKGVYQSKGRGRGRRRGLVVALAAVVAVAVLGGIGWYVLRPDASAGNGSSGDGGRGHSGDALPPSGWHSAYTSALTSDDQSWWKANVRDDQTNCLIGPSGLTAHMEKQTTAGASGLFRCNGPQPSFTDVAIQVTVKVTSGCAAIWLRTGDKEGYFLDACGSTASLFVLTTSDPSNSNMIHSWSIGDDVTAGPVALGLLAQGSTLSVWNGTRRLGSLSDDAITSGQVDLGAFTGTGDSAEILYRNVKVWQPS
jgi:actin-like ATPase involved in cell morphogenesis